MLLPPFEPWDGKEYLALPVLMKAQGKCTTDHISAAGKWLKFRGHLENISGNLFAGAVNAFSGVAGEAVDFTDGEVRTYPDMAKRWSELELRWVAIGDRNYGEGSSREHAAMEPRWRGGVAIITRSFARIHETNLKKQGLVPLTFDDPDIYDLIEPGDRISILDLPPVPGQQVHCQIVKPDGPPIDFQANHTFSDEQVEWFKAGSALNIVRQKVAADQPTLTRPMVLGTRSGCWDARSGPRVAAGVSRCRGGGCARRRGRPPGALPGGYVRASSSAVGVCRRRASGGRTAVIADMIRLVSAFGDRYLSSTGVPTRTRTSGGSVRCVTLGSRAERGQTCSVPHNPTGMTGASVAAASRAAPQRPLQRRGRRTPRREGSCPAASWRRPRRRPVQRSPRRAARPSPCPVRRGCRPSPCPARRSPGRRTPPSCRGSGSAGPAGRGSPPSPRRRSSCGGWRRRSPGPRPAGARCRRCRTWRTGT